MEINGILIHPDDNVVTVLRNVAEGEPVTAQGLSDAVVARQPVELGHKVARRDIAQGEVIYKYGCPMGSATQSIARGEHVHTHNIASDRGRGDLQ